MLNNLAIGFILLILLADANSPGRGKFSYSYLIDLYNYSTTFISSSNSKECKVLDTKVVSNLFLQVRNYDSLSVSRLSSLVRNTPACSKTQNTILWLTSKGQLEIKINGSKVLSIKEIP